MAMYFHGGDSHRLDSLLQQDVQQTQHSSADAMLYLMFLREISGVPMTAEAP